MKFRQLKAEEIECRIQTIGEKGCSLLLYKDARCDMNILDEEVGADNWQRKHYECKGNLFCSVGIKVEDNWVWKDDCGTESNAEKQKGEASDSFKRACVNWGIGRELYTAPFIFIPSSDIRIFDKNNKKATYDKFYVSEIDYDQQNRIQCLKIHRKADKDRPEKCVYTYAAGTQKSSHKRITAKAEYIDEIQQKALLNTLEAVGWNLESALGYLQEKFPNCAPQTIEEITIQQFTPFIKTLESRREKLEKQENHP